MSSYHLVQADAGRLPFADDAFDLVFGSPPYMDARTYGIAAQRKCRAWIDWMLTVTAEAVRVSRGLVIWIVGGVTRKHIYQPGCEGLLYRWWEQGGRCWRPAYWHRNGIPGSGGKQWLRADIEQALVFTKCDRKIPWADNTANGHPPKWGAGGGHATLRFFPRCGRLFYCGLDTTGLKRAEVLRLCAAMVKGGGE